MGDTLHWLEGVVVVDEEAHVDHLHDLRGTLTLEGEGYRIDGSFRVRECADLAQLSI